MVLLTMTPSIVEALKQLQDDATATEAAPRAVAAEAGEPDLASPAVAQPVSHAQVLRLWKALPSRPDATTPAGATTLETLLAGARVYVPPPPPKPEPVCTPLAPPRPPPLLPPPLLFFCSLFRPAGR